MSATTPLGESIEREDWFSQPTEDVLLRLGADRDGLRSAEADRRLVEFGSNELKEAQPIGLLPMFFRQFKSLILWLLIAAGAVSGLLGQWVDSLAILAIVVLNAVMGFCQEFKAEKAIAALKRMTAPLAEVRRDGQAVLVPAASVVPGDILALNAGNLVAADARLLEAASLRCVESALTGESEPVEKRASVMEPGAVALGDRQNMVLMGTSVAAGRGRAVVVATGMQTELGRIAGLIVSTDGATPTPLEKKLEAFGRVLVWSALGIVALLFGLGWLRGMKLFELFMTSVTLAVAAVPEGLPAVVTVALALGVLRMSRRRALVRNLPAVETLGSTSVICTDKTGTLTVGEMTVRALYVANRNYEVSGEGYAPEGEVLQGGESVSDTVPLLELATVLVGCNNAHLVEKEGAWGVIGDPTEGALLVAGAKAGVDLEGLEKEMPRYHEIPFDSDRKRGSIVRKTAKGELRAFVNGAPAALLQCCTSLYTREGIRLLTDADRKSILAQTTLMAQQALRVLGAAYGDLDGGWPEELTSEAVERDLVFVGLAGMYDPPRPASMQAVAECRSAGIRVVMITGDHPDTAMAIAREIGIVSGEEEVLDGVGLDALTDEELQNRVSQIAVFARVTAQHKLRIIRAWKANHAVVAMTGDGVNDGPAIKGADIGIAMGRSGTEVAKQVADIIITDDNFASIVAAVEEGRGIYSNIRKTLQYLLAGNVGELLLMTICVVVGLPLPLLPIHLLWINLVTDGLPALCLATDPIDSEVMGHHPRAHEERIADSSFLRGLGLTGFLTAGVSFAVFLYGLKTGSLETARTQTFAVLVFAELLRSFGARSETKPIWHIPFFTNINLALVVAGSIAVQVWSQHSEALGRFLRTSPMPFTECMWLLALGSLPLLILEMVKLLFRSRYRDVSAGPLLAPIAPG